MANTAINAPVVKRDKRTGEDGGEGAREGGEGLDGGGEGE